jgi:hypothetical protein
LPLTILYIAYSITLLMRINFREDQNSIIGKGRRGEPWRFYSSLTKYYLIETVFKSFSHCFEIIVLANVTWNGLEPTGSSFRRFTSTSTSTYCSSRVSVEKPYVWCVCFYSRARSIFALNKTKTSSNPIYI